MVGGGSGLGAASARRLAAEGYAVTVADLDEGAAGAVAAELGPAPARAVACDVRDRAAVESAVSLAGEAGPLRVLVVCAGIGFSERAAGHSEAGLELTIDVNLTGTLRAIAAGSAAIAATEPAGADGERGVIVCTASVAAFDGQTGQLAYAASKAGVAGVVLPAARDLSSKGIRVCAIAPGTFATPLLAGLPEKAVEGLSQQVPFPRRPGRPEEFGRLVAAIVANPLLNGAVLRLDGALRMPFR